jgi:phage terminase large subunit
MCEEPEVLFGGAAGGGKSDAMLMAALQYVHVPNYSALILRRTYPQLAQEGGLIPRSQEWLTGTGAKWNEQKKSWTFPSGAVLAFGHMQHETTKYDYQSGEYQFIGFEELTQFTATQYTYMHSRTRRLEGSIVPIRIYSTSNPGGVGHKWVKARFLDTLLPGRRFIQSLLDDNPSLDTEEYERSLGNLTELERRQLREGDWLVSPDDGAVFENVVCECISDEQIAEFDRIYNGVDFGYDPDPWAFTRSHYDAARQTLYIFDEAVARKMSNADSAEIIKTRLGQERDAKGEVTKYARRERVICDSAESKSIADYKRANIDAWADKKGPGSVEYGIKWLATRARIVIDPIRCPNAAREFTEYEHDRARDGEITSGYPDRDNHTIDSVRYACTPLMGRHSSA